MRVYLQRRRVFSCAHRYFQPSRDEAWNHEHFGDLTEIHGHNYLAEVTLCGDVDAQSGIVVNLTDVKQWLADAVSPFENRFVDVTSPVMENLQPSTENLCRIVWKRLVPHIETTPATLSRLRIAETDELWSEYAGDSDMVCVTRVYDFSAAHRLHSEQLPDDQNLAIFGKCNHPGGHGHNYVVDVTVKGMPDPDTGFAYPIDALDRLVEEKVIRVMDHRHLNTDVPQFKHLNPTSENLAVVIWNILLPDLGPALHKIRVQETPRNFFEYYGD